jgi:hypothetical protein
MTIFRTLVSVRQMAAVRRGMAGSGLVEGAIRLALEETKQQIPFGDDNRKATATATGTATAGLLGR